MNSRRQDHNNKYCYSVISNAATTTTTSHTTAKANKKVPLGNKIYFERETSV
jgi:hypothetical protein